MRRSGVIAALTLATLAWLPQTTAAAGVGLDGPEVFKLDWNTRSLRVADVDGDGRNDLALINNARAKIDILYQRKPGRVERAEQRASRRRWEPVLEDARFRKESVVTGAQMFALASGDLDGDGLADLAYTGDPDGLTVLYQGPEGRWDRRRGFESENPSPWTSSLEIADLDADGANELVMLAERALLVFEIGERGALASPERYPLADEGCYGLRLADADGDGLLDAVYLAANDPYPWRVRFQRASGLGPERTFRIPAVRRGLEPLRLDGETVFAAVQDQTGLIELLTLRAKESADARVPSLSPRVYSTPTGDNAAASYALGDMDGDGRDDLLVADRKGAQLWLYAKTGSAGYDPPVAFPSLSDLRSLAAGDVDGDRRAELFAVSRGEGLLGVSRLDDEGRLGYPNRIPLEGKPLAATTLDLDDDGRQEVACLLDRGGRGVAILRHDQDAWTETSYLPLPDLRTDPDGVAAIDADQDGRSDLVLFIPRSPARVLLQRDAATFDDVSTTNGFRSGLLDGLTAAGLTVGDADGDGNAEMIVAGRGYARALRVRQNGTLEVVDQFNSLDRDAQIAAALLLDLDADATAEALLVHEGGDQVELLRKGRKGVYRHERTLSVGRIDLVETRVPRNDELLLLGADRFWSVPLEGADLEPQSLGVHESEFEDVQYTALAFADFDADGTPEMVTLDTKETRKLEVLARDPETGDWRAVLDFTVFDADSHYQGRKGASNEPREMLVADVTDDGLPDVVLLVHDRVLVYPGR